MKIDRVRVVFLMYFFQILLQLLEGPVLSRRTAPEPAAGRRTDALRPSFLQLGPTECQSKQKSMVYEVKIFRKGCRKHLAVNETCAARAVGAGFGVVCGGIAAFSPDPATRLCSFPCSPVSELGGGPISRAVGETGLPQTDGAVAFFFCRWGGKSTYWFRSQPGGSVWDQMQRGGSNLKSNHIWPLFLRRPETGALQSILADFSFQQKRPVLLYMG